MAVWWIFFVSVFVDLDSLLVHKYKKNELVVAISSHLDFMLVQ